MLAVAIGWGAVAPAADAVPPGDAAPAIARAAAVPAAPTVPPGDTAPAIARLAAELAREAGRIGRPERTVLGVSVRSAAAPALAAAVEARLVDELRAGPFRDAFPAPTREAAEADGADAHLLVSLELAGELAAAGELAPLRVNFFTGRPTGPGGLVSAAVPADREARLLAAAGPAPRGPAADLEVRRWVSLAAPPLGLAAGDLDGDGTPEVVVLDERAVLLFDAAARPLARFALCKNAEEAPGGPPARPGAAAGVPEAPACVPIAGPGAVPVRDPAGAVAVASGTIRFAAPALGLAGTLRLDGGALTIAGWSGTDEPAPLAAGPAGLLAAPWIPGTNAFGPGVESGPAFATAGGPLYGAAAAPAPGALAFALVRDDGAIELLAADLAPAAPPLAGAGAAAALADLDGDGAAELLATSPSLEAPDRIRVFAVAPRTPPAPRAESGAVPGRLLAGAAADLDGDGRDEALFAGPAAGGGAAIWQVREADR